MCLFHGTWNDRWCHLAVPAQRLIKTRFLLLAKKTADGGLYALLFVAPKQREKEKVRKK